MTIQDGAVPMWVFDVDEVSAGVYRVIGTDSTGRSIEEKGVDPEALLSECKRLASEMDLMDVDAEQKCL